MVGEGVAVRIGGVGGGREFCAGHDFLTGRGAVKFCQGRGAVGRGLAGPEGLEHVAGGSGFSLGGEDAEPCGRGFVLLSPEESVAAAAVAAGRDGGPVGSEDGLCFRGAGLLQRCAPCGARALPKSLRAKLSDDPRARPLHICQVLAQAGQRAVGVDARKVEAGRVLVEARGFLRGQSGDRGEAGMRGVFFVHEFGQDFELLPVGVVASVAFGFIAEAPEEQRRMIAKFAHVLLHARRLPGAVRGIGIGKPFALRLQPNAGADS